VSIIEFSCVVKITSIKVADDSVILVGCVINCMPKYATKARPYGLFGSSYRTELEYTKCVCLLAFAVGEILV